MTSERRLATLGLRGALLWGTLAYAVVACDDDEPATKGNSQDNGDAGASATPADGGASASGSSQAAAGASAGGAGSASTDFTRCVSDGRLVITDDTNYSFSSTMTVQSTTVKDATDLTFDWSQVSLDFFEREVDPRSDIDLVAISLWGMTESELQANLNRDNLPLGSNLGALTFYNDNDVDHANLLEFDSFGSPISEDELWSRFDTSTPGYKYPPEDHTFMVMVATGEVPGKGTRMLGFFKLDPDSTNTVVTLTNDSTTLDYTVDLASITRIPVPAGMAELSIDWSQMTTNALGNEYLGTQITNAVVAHYSMTLAELEEQFVFLEERSDGWWEADVLAGTSIALDTLEDADGNTFAGIDDEGVWLVALRCTTNCNNPAPWSITVLKPCP